MFPVRMVIAAIGTLACAPAAGTTVRTSVNGTAGAAAIPPSTSASAPRPIGITRPSHTAADVHFMTGMIHHHAQAVLVANWATTHEASGELQRLAERIAVGQSDEIDLMRHWLAAKGQPVPEPTPGPMRMKIDGMDHELLMPGMLTADQLAQLDAARGAAYDTLFLTRMIQHHEGAITMVNTLFASPGAGQDEVVFRFASDVVADQSTEIARMRSLLRARGRSVSPP